VTTLRTFPILMSLLVRIHDTTDAWKRLMVME
jgi:hypothetical protein